MKLGEALLQGYPIGIIYNRNGLLVKDNKFYVFKLFDERTPLWSLTTENEDEAVEALINDYH